MSSNPLTYKIVPKNLLQSIQKAKISNAANSGLTRRCFNDCMGRFVLIHVTNRIMYSIALECADELEECGKLKFKAKQHWKEAQNAFDKYDKVMRKNMSKDAWSLQQDYVVVAERYLNVELNELEESMYDYLVDKGFTWNASLLAHLALAVRLAQISTIWFKELFKTYKELCGIDFSFDYEYAKMDNVLFALIRLFDVLIPKKDIVIDFWKCDKCQKAAMALQVKLASEEFLDNAAEKALSFSEVCKEEYEIIKKQNDKKYGRHN